MSPATTASSLVMLLIKLGRHPASRWALHAEPETARACVQAAAESGPELQELRACYPDPLLRELRLQHLVRVFEVPQDDLDRLLDRLAVGPARPDATAPVADAPPAMARWRHCQRGHRETWCPHCRQCPLCQGLGREGDEHIA